VQAHAGSTAGAGQGERTSCPFGVSRSSPVEEGTKPTAACTVTAEDWQHSAEASTDLAVMEGRVAATDWLIEKCRRPTYGSNSAKSSTARSGAHA
jgi:hypothetical protein